MSVKVNTNIAAIVNAIPEISVAKTTHHANLPSIIFGKHFSVSVFHGICHVLLLVRSMTYISCWTSRDANTQIVFAVLYSYSSSYQVGVKINFVIDSFKQHRQNKTEQQLFIARKSINSLVFHSDRKNFRPFYVYPFALKFSLSILLSTPVRFSMHTKFSYISTNK